MTCCRPAGFLVVVALLTGVAGAAAAAEGTGSVEGTAEEGATAAGVSSEASRDDPYVLGTWRLRAAWPLQVAGAVGALRGRRSEALDCTTVCEFRGLHVQAEAGTGGAQLAAGWASLVGETDRSGRWLSRVYVGYAVRGVLLRSGGWSTLNPAAQTFAGVEGTFAATRTSISVAVYRRVSRAPSSEPWVVGAGVGWGF
jgi:hypothetical protein